MRENTAIARRDEPDLSPALGLLGTTDPHAAIARAIEMAELLDKVVRDRGLARTFGESDRAFYEWPAWQILGTWLGLSCIVVWTKPLADGWEARAEARRLDGTVLGAAEAMCSASEKGRQRSSAHDVRAMAQVRAQRNALRSAIGFLPALAGLDVSDPDAPATRKQIVALHTLAGQRGWDHAESHRRAGVDSFRDLSREAAASLLDEWSTLTRDADTDQADATVDAPSDDREELLALAVEAYGGRVPLLRAAIDRSPTRGGLALSSLSVEDLSALLSGAPT
jgi:hypothetical protein